MSDARDFMKDYYTGLGSAEYPTTHPLGQPPERRHTPGRRASDYLYDARRDAHAAVARDAIATTLRFVQCARRMSQTVRDFALLVRTSGITTTADITATLERAAECANRMQEVVGQLEDMIDPHPPGGAESAASEATPGAPPSAPDVPP